MGWHLGLLLLGAEPLRAESALRSQTARALAHCALASVVRRGAEAAQRALGGRLVRARSLMGLRLG